MDNRTYLCIDLKSFYASVECVELHLDPLTTDLVVADPERTDKTICLAVSPSLKKKGVRNRCRLFEIPSHLEYIIAPPRMRLYIEYAADIYGIYLKYVAKEDIHVYSIDEAWLDVTDYLHLYDLTARELAIRIMNDIYKTKGITATCGIGTNLYLSKVALDITAKHSPDFIGYLDEETYRKTLWDHLPLTDFWRVGPGVVRRLERNGMKTMRDIAKGDEELLYRLFGIDAELLIDHAWGREPVRIKDIKNYHSKSTSLSSGQVLARGYSYEEGETIVREMTAELCLDLASKGLIAGHVSLYLGFERDQDIPSNGKSMSLVTATNNETVLTDAIMQIYRKVFVRNELLRRVGIGFGLLKDESEEEVDLFTDEEQLKKDRQLQKTILQIKQKYGKNAVIKALSMNKEATAKERNNQIGGHQSDYKNKK